MVGSGSRSWLFVPGTRPDRFSKAQASGADRVILDLEDSVALSDKNDARESVANGLDAQRPTFVRINAFDTVHFEQDIELVTHPGLRGFMVPKAENLPAPLVESCLLHHKVLVPLVETALGFSNIEAIARTPAVERLAFGSIDFQLDLEIDGDEALDTFRSRFALISRLVGLAAPVDGVTMEIKDPDVVRRDAQRARRFGFGGKLCIHPAQVAIVNEAMSPSEAQLTWARAIIAAAERNTNGVFELDGKMIDKPVIARARRWLSAS